MARSYLLLWRSTPINIGRCKELTDACIEAITVKCPSLTSLNVRGTYLTHEAIEIADNLRFTPAARRHNKNIEDEAIRAIRRNLFNSARRR